jgi:cobaltochelatase CobN
MKRLVSGVALVLTLVTWPGAGEPGAQSREPRTQNQEPRAESREPIRVAYVFSDGNLPGTLKAFKSVLQERPDLRGRVALTFLTESVMADVKVDEISRANVLVLDTMNQQMLERFNATHKIDLISQVRGGLGKVLGVGEGLLPKETYLKQGVIFDERARTYWAHMGYSNQVGLLKYALTQAGISGLSLPPPQPSLDFGFYYPASSMPTDPRVSAPRDPGQVFATWDEFNAWRRQRGKLRPGALRIAVSFYKATYYSDETELLDAVIGQIERSGAEAIPMFGYPGEVAAERLLLNADGTSRADVVLGFNFNFAGPDSSTLLAKVDVPVINLISLYGRGEREWRESPMGLSMFEGTFNVAVPELAGTIAPTVVGSQEKVTDPETGLTIVVRKPIPSQIAMAVSRATKWAALRGKTNREKRVALVFYNYPAGKANIGASYLNVAESLASILQRLKAEGYDVGNSDLSGGSVLQTLLAKARNVGGYAPGELQELVNAGSAVKISAAQYARWLDALSPSLKAKILKDWGTPGTSRLMTVDGGLVIPAVQFGKIALLPQPSRGWGEDSEKMYHAKDLAPHHQYVAAYAWLRDGFGADAVVHIGTHGTLEWLDGKDIGLSNDDAPDALISDLPHLYIYNVDVVGEGLVARRRAVAALVDHMVPPFKKGGLYPELAALGESINDFDTSLHKNPELAKAVGERIRQQVVALGLTKDLGLDLSKPESLSDEIVHQIQDHLLTLKGENIPYGLHTFGRVPDKLLRETTVDAIVSVDRSLLPS